MHHQRVVDVDEEGQLLLTAEAEDVDPLQLTRHAHVVAPVVRGLDARVVHRLSTRGGKLHIRRFSASVDTVGC